MSYEAWVIIGLLVNTVLGAVGIVQRHLTFQKLDMDKFPTVHQPRTWSVQRGSQYSKNDQQDKGASTDCPYHDRSGEG